MLKYVEDLVGERDHLTEMAQALGDLAHSEERQLTDAERAQLTEWQSRCSELDTEIDQHSKVLESTRKWADLKGRLESNSKPLPVPRRNQPVLEHRSVGQMFIESDVFQGYNGAGTSPNVHLPAVLDHRAWSLRQAPGEDDPNFIQSTQLAVPPYTFEPARATWQTPLLNLVSVEPISTGSVEYFYFKPVLPPEAALVPEGTAKPPVEVTLELQSAPLQTFAHWKAITRQALEDYPRIRTIVEEYLRGGVIRKMESVIASALLGNTDINTSAVSGLLAAVRLGMAMVEQQGFVPNALLMNANDWAQLDISLLERTLLGPGGPTGSNAFWSLTPVTSPDVPSGQAYVGDFRDGVTFFDRRVTDVRLTDSHLGYFIENKIVILAEARGLAVVTQPQAVVKCTGSPTDLTGGGGTTAPPGGVSMSVTPGSTPSTASVTVV